MFRGNKLLKFFDRFVGIPLCFILGLLSKLNRKYTKKSGKIAVIKLAALGDTVLLVPVFRALKKKFKNAEIIFICTHINKGLLDNSPYITKAIEFPIKDMLLKPFKFFKWLSIVKKENINIVIDADQWSRVSSFISILINSPTRIGFKTKGQFRHYVYTDVIEHKRDKHEVKCLLDLLNPLDIETNDASLELWPSKNDYEFIRKHINVKKPVVIHPGCGVHGGPRQWPISNYTELANRLISKKEIVVMTGSGYERSIIGKIADLMRAKPYILCNIKPLQLAALLEKAKVFISGNTGPMHIAAACKTPIVALHGPTDPKRWGPIGNNHIVIQAKTPECVPCLYLGFEYACKDYQCMKSITVEEVESKVKQYL